MSRSPSIQPMQLEKEWTSDTVFADSAISMDSTVPTSQNSPRSLTEPRSQKVDITVSERLSQLTAVAWANEQDGESNAKRGKKLRQALDLIEALLDGDKEDDTLSSTREVETTASSIQIEQPTSDEMDPTELQEIQQSLMATVAAMRLRQQEQSHIHQISVQKLENVAHSCLMQQKQLHDLSREIQGLRHENRELGEENDGLNDHVGLLESKIAEKDIAVNAMSSAVAGLEGWINNSPDTTQHFSQMGTRRTPQQKVVIKGRGRFRGRYLVEQPTSNDFRHGMDGTTDVKDFHDGVKAWLRGFRDVEEELHISSTDSNVGSKERDVFARTEDDWGEFVSGR